MKRPAIAKLTLREKIGQTAALRQRFLNNVTDLEAYFRRNPYGSIWTLASNKKMNDMENVADEFGDCIDFEADIKNKRYIEQIIKYMKIPFRHGCRAGMQKGFPIFFGNHIQYRYCFHRCSAGRFRNCQMYCP